MAIDPELVPRLRRAYEWGRLRSALRIGWLVAPIAIIAAPVCGDPTFTAAMGGVLYVACAGLLWRGEEYGEAVGAGLLAGAAPVVLALLFRGAGHECQRDFCFTVNIPVCIVGGVLAGAAVALRAARTARRRVAFVVAGCLVAGLTGSLGCIFSGLAGLIGMSAGVLAGTAPVLVWSALRR